MRRPREGQSSAHCSQDIVDRLGATKSPQADIVGPASPSSGLQRELGVERGVISKAVKSRRIALRLPADGENLYPAFQDRRLPACTRVEQVLTVLQSGIDDPWTWTQWLNTPGVTTAARTSLAPIDLSLAGELGAVLNEARYDAAFGRVTASHAARADLKARPDCHLARNGTLVPLARR